MGYSSWSDEAYSGLAAERSTKSGGEIFRGTGQLHPTMSPAGLGNRESRDSAEHPNSNGVIVAFDVTGSMGDIPVRFAKNTLGRLMRLLVDRKYMGDPQVLFAAVGDAQSDRAPLQIGQFESGLEMDMWLTRMWLEGGGGDAPESYTLAHYFAAYHTSVDGWEKRHRRGFLFTIGDERPKPLDQAQIARVFGEKSAHDVSNEALVKAASAQWHTFHVHVTRGRAADPAVVGMWRQLLGDRLLILDNVDAICELIGVTIGVVEGTLTLATARDDLRAVNLGQPEIDAILATVAAAAKSG